MSRLVWFGIGAVAGGYVALRGRDKAREIAHQARPAQLGRTVGRAIGQQKVVVTESVAEFLANVADGARQREDELHTQMIMPPDHPSTRP